MMRRRLAAAGVLAFIGLASSGAPALADRASAPAQRCGDANIFAIQYTAHYDGATAARDGVYVRAVPTRGGCASSWAHADGQLSTAAVASQCRTGVEARFGPYPIVLRFAVDHVLRNRADCIRVLTGVSHGEVDPGPAPLFPGGVPS